MVFRNDRIGSVRYNNKGYQAECTEYIDANHIIVRFIDGITISTSWKNFNNGNFKYPYTPKKNGGIAGINHPATKNGQIEKDYDSWCGIIRRCNEITYDTYLEAKVCDEWIYYDNFYEWIHNQSNYNKWILLPRSSVDKDIIIKNNKLYSPDTCCLVPHNVNCLFTKTEKLRGDYPIGVYYRKDNNNYEAQCHDPRYKKQVFCGYYNTPEEAFYYGYKPYKESLIKTIAKEEFDNGNIDKRCYEAMMSYFVEITD